MIDSVPEAIPDCLDNYCSKFDDIFQNSAQRKHFREYTAGLLGESHRKNIMAIAESTLGCDYVNLHHFLHNAPWDADALNERRIDIAWQHRNTRPQVGYRHIIDDSGHRKSGSETDGVARQYIGQIGKVDNGAVMVTSHACDDKRCVPLDLAQYFPASCLPNGKEDEQFKTKPQIAIDLIDKSLERGLKPGRILADSFYGDNINFLLELEKRKLEYVVTLKGRRNVYVKLPGDHRREKHRLDEVVKTITAEQLTKVVLQGDKLREVWVAIFAIHFPNLTGTRTLAIQLDAPSVAEAKEVDYILTNASEETATAAWIAREYSSRNWIEVFYRETKGWLGLTEYQVRNKNTIYRHWMLVFLAFSFITRQRLTGGLRAQWSTHPLQTFGQTWRVFRHAVELQALNWLANNIHVFLKHRMDQGFKCQRTFRLDFQTQLKLA
jgi:SRSO17 transposase